MVQGSTHASGVMGGGGGGGVVVEGVCIDVTPGGGSKIPHAVAMWPNEKPLNSQCWDFSILTHYLSYA